MGERKPQRKGLKSPIASVNKGRQKEKKEIGMKNVFLEEYYKGIFLGKSNRKGRFMSMGELKKRVSRLNEKMLAQLKSANELNNVHLMFSKLCALLQRKLEREEEEIKRQELQRLLEQCQRFCALLAAKDLEFLPEISEEELEAALKLPGIRRYLLSNSLLRAYELFYIPKTIEKEIQERIPEKPEDEYPETRKLQRNFVLHVGPTNSGKTHDALERLKESSHGAYFGPLRLLALEVSDKLNAEGVPCSMVTGEESVLVAGATCTACTVEMLNDREYFDIVVVDECQMIGDPHRGSNWTKAILGLRAEEIHLCMAPEAETVVLQMIKRCQDNYKVIRHRRSTKLQVEKEPYVLGRDLQKGDALIVFSKKSVLALAAHLEREAKVKASVIYGSLPPASRREQVRRFLEGETEVVVSTDAIGMGLNLPIRRVVFVETQKYDGVLRRKLNHAEIKQIAGRAGRFGLYQEGYVAAVEDVDLIVDGVNGNSAAIRHAYIGFPERLLELPSDIDNLIKIWVAMDTPYLYRKMEVDELLALYQAFVHINGIQLDEFKKEEIYKLITCSIDLNNRYVMNLWRDYCREYRQVEELDFPYTIGENLYDLESYYKMLDLYFQFSRKVNLPIQTELLEEERRNTEEEINRILKTECGSYTRKCAECGRELPWNYTYSVCERCYFRIQYRRGRF